LEYGYQQQQFCKMPCFCIPVLLNESSPPFPGLFFFTAILSIKINILVLGCDWFYELFYYHIEPMIQIHVFYIFFSFPFRCFSHILLANQARTWFQSGRRPYNLQFVAIIGLSQVCYYLL
jgi:hypothetical protein